tara:strand:+ start:450 stop:953 length:504 start_codon:yes stop_codon:yes gene_type:complete
MVANLRIEYTSDSFKVSIDREVEELLDIINLQHDFQVLIESDFPDESLDDQSDTEDDKQFEFEFDGQTLMKTESVSSDSFYYTNGQGQLNGQHGTSTDTKTTWEKVVDQELIYRQNEENEKAALNSNWPFPLDRPAEGTLRVDSPSDESIPSVPNAMDYRALYYGGA